MDVGAIHHPIPENLRHFVIEHARNSALKACFGNHQMFVKDIQPIKPEGIARVFGNPDPGYADGNLGDARAGFGLLLAEGHVFFAHLRAQRICHVFAHDNFHCLLWIAGGSRRHLSFDQIDMCIKVGDKAKVDPFERITIGTVGLVGWKEAEVIGFGVAHSHCNRQPNAGYARTCHIVINRRDFIPLFQPMQRASIAPHKGKRRATEVAVFIQPLKLFLQNTIIDCVGIDRHGHDHCDRGN